MGHTLSALVFLGALLLTVLLFFVARARARREDDRRREDFTVDADSVAKNMDEYEARLYVIRMIETGRRKRATPAEIEKYQALRNRRAIRRAFRHDTGIRVPAKSLRDHAATEKKESKETYSSSPPAKKDDKVAVLRRLKEISEAVDDLYRHVEEQTIAAASPHTCSGGGGVCRH